MENLKRNFLPTEKSPPEYIWSTLEKLKDWTKSFAAKNLIATSKTSSNRTVSKTGKYNVYHSSQCRRSSNHLCSSSRTNSKLSSTLSINKQKFRVQCRENCTEHHHEIHENANAQRKRKPLNAEVDKRNSKHKCSHCGAKNNHPSSVHTSNSPTKSKYKHDEHNYNSKTRKKENDVIDSKYKNTESDSQENCTCSSRRKDKLKTNEQSHYYAEHKNPGHRKDFSYPEKEEYVISYSKNEHVTPPNRNKYQNEAHKTLNSNYECIDLNSLPSNNNKRKNNENPNSLPSNNNKRKNNEDKNIVKQQENKDFISSPSNRHKSYKKEHKTHEDFRSLVKDDKLTVNYPRETQIFYQSFSRLPNNASVPRNKTEDERSKNNKLKQEKNQPGSSHPKNTRSPARKELENNLVKEEGTHQIKRNYVESLKSRKTDDKAGHHNKSPGPERTSRRHDKTEKSNISVLSPKSKRSEERIRMSHHHHKEDIENILFPNNLPKIQPQSERKRKDPKREDTNSPISKKVCKFDDHEIHDEDCALYNYMKRKKLKKLNHSVEKSDNYETDPTTIETPPRSRKHHTNKIPNSAAPTNKIHKDLSLSGTSEIVNIEIYPKKEKAKKYDKEYNTETSTIDDIPINPKHDLSEKKPVTKSNSAKTKPPKELHKNKYPRHEKDNKQINVENNDTTTDTLKKLLVDTLITNKIDSENPKRNHKKKVKSKLKVPEKNYDSEISDTFQDIQYDQLVPRYRQKIVRNIWKSDSNMMISQKLPIEKVHYEEQVSTRYEQFRQKDKLLESNNQFLVENSKYERSIHITEHADKKRTKRKISYTSTTTTTSQPVQDLNENETQNITETNLTTNHYQSSQDDEILRDIKLKVCISKRRKNVVTPTSSKTSSKKSLHTHKIRKKFSVTKTRPTIPRRHIKPAGKTPRTQLPTNKQVELEKYQELLTVKRKSIPRRTLKKQDDLVNNEEMLGLIQNLLQVIQNEFQTSQIVDDLNTNKLADHQIDSSVEHLEKLSKNLQDSQKLTNRMFQEISMKIRDTLNRLKNNLPPYQKTNFNTKSIQKGNQIIFSSGNKTYQTYNNNNTKSILKKFDANLFQPKIKLNRKISENSKPVQFRNRLMRRKFYDKCLRSKMNNDAVPHLNFDTRMPFVTLAKIDETEEPCNIEFKTEIKKPRNKLRPSTQSKQNKKENYPEHNIELLYEQENFKTDSVSDKTSSKISVSERQENSVKILYKTSQFGKKNRGKKSKKCMKHLEETITESARATSNISKSHNLLLDEVSKQKMIPEKLNKQHKSFVKVDTPEKPANQLKSKTDCYLDKIQDKQHTKPTIDFQKPLKREQINNQIKNEDDGGVVDKENKIKFTRSKSEVLAKNDGINKMKLTKSKTEDIVRRVNVKHTNIPILIRRTNIVKPNENINKVSEKPKLPLKTHETQTFSSVKSPRNENNTARKMNATKISENQNQQKLTIAKHNTEQIVSERNNPKNKAPLKPTRKTNTSNSVGVTLKTRNTSPSKDNIVSNISDPPAEPAKTVNSTKRPSKTIHSNPLKIDKDSNKSNPVTETPQSTVCKSKKSEKQNTKVNALKIPSLKTENSSLSIDSNKSKPENPHLPTKTKAETKRINSPSKEKSIIRSNVVKKVTAPSKIVPKKSGKVKSLKEITEEFITTLDTQYISNSKTTTDALLDSSLKVPESTATETLIPEREIRTSKKLVEKPILSNYAQARQNQFMSSLNATYINKIPTAAAETREDEVIPSLDVNYIKIAKVIDPPKPVVQPKNYRPFASLKVTVKNDNTIFPINYKTEKFYKKSTTLSNNKSVPSKDLRKTKDAITQVHCFNKQNSVILMPELDKISSQKLTSKTEISLHDEVKFILEHKTSNSVISQKDPVQHDYKLESTLKQISNKISNSSIAQTKPDIIEVLEKISRQSIRKKCTQKNSLHKFHKTKLKTVSYGLKQKPKVNTKKSDHKINRRIKTKNEIITSPRIPSQSVDTDGTSKIPILKKYEPILAEIIEKRSNLVERNIRAKRVLFEQYYQPKTNTSTDNLKQMKNRNVKSVENRSLTTRNFINNRSRKDDISDKNKNVYRMKKANIFLTNINITNSQPMDKENNVISQETQKISPQNNSQPIDKEKSVISQETPKISPKNNSKPMDKKIKVISQKTPEISPQKNEPILKETNSKLSTKIETPKKVVSSTDSSKSYSTIVTGDNKQIKSKPVYKRDNKLNIVRRSRHRIKKLPTQTKIEPLTTKRIPAGNKGNKSDLKVKNCCSKIITKPNESKNSNITNKSRVKLYNKTKKQKSFVDENKKNLERYSKKPKSIQKPIQNQFDDLQIIGLPISSIRGLAQTDSAQAISIKHVQSSVNNIFPNINKTTTFIEVSMIYDNNRNYGSSAHPSTTSTSTLKPSPSLKPVQNEGAKPMDQLILNALKETLSKTYCQTKQESIKCLKPSPNLKLVQNEEDKPMDQLNLVELKETLSKTYCDTKRESIECLKKYNENLEKMKILENLSSEMMGTTLDDSTPETSDSTLNGASGSSGSQPDSKSSRGLIKKFKKLLSRSRLTKK